MTVEAKEAPVAAPQVEEIEPIGTVEDLIEESPVIETAQPETEEHPLTNPEEPTKKEPEKKTEEPSDEKGKEEPGKEPEDETEPEEAPKFKVGELELTEAEWLERNKAFENQTEWKKNLTTKSQIAGNLTDEQIEKILSSTENLKSIPVPEEYDAGDLKEIDLTSDEPFNVQVTDEDGLEFDVDLKPYLKPFIQAQQQETAKITKELTQLKEENAVLQQENGLNAMKSAMIEIPDLKIDDLDMNKLDQILTSGETHPDYIKLMRYKSAVNFATENKLSFKAGYARLFAKEIAEQKEAERIAKNKSKAAPEKPAQAPVKDASDEFYENEFGDDVVGRVNALP